MAKKAKGNGDVTVTPNGDAVYTPQPSESNGNGTTAAKPGETKSQRFVRLANRRVSRCLLELSKLEPLGNRSQYEYSQTQADTINQALQLAVDRVADKLALYEAPSPTFQLESLPEPQREQADASAEQYAPTQ